MQQKNKISIIIPIYNGGSFLERCFRSIQIQTYKNLEILLINDGSTDNSKEICEQWIEKDNRFRLYNNNNMGVSYSRNFGIEKASGDYAIFVDCDDYIEENMIEVLACRINKFDYVMINYNKYYSENNIIKNLEVEDRTYDKKEFFENFWKLYNANMINSPCNKIFKTEILKNHNIKFNLEYDLGEDLLLNLEYINKCKTFCAVNQYLYNYCYTINSLTTKYRENYLETQLFLNNSIKEFFIQNNYYGDIQQNGVQENIGNIIISSIQSLFIESNKLKTSQIRKILEKYLNISEIEVLKNVQYKEKRLEIFKNMIIKRRINLIIIYSRIKELIRKIIKIRIE